MKRISIFLFACLFGMWSTLSAQDTTRSSDAVPPHWVTMSDSAGHAIGLTEDQKQGWHERSTRWDSKYEALGKDPEHHPTYIKLHSAREFDLKGFLTGGQYDKWEQLNKRSPRLEDNNPPGTNMPPQR